MLPGAQNISAPPLSIRELRSTELESYEISCVRTSLQQFRRLRITAVRDAILRARTAHSRPAHFGVRRLASRAVDPELVPFGRRTAAHFSVRLHESFRHHHEMARQFRSDLRGKRFRTTLDVAEPPVELRQLRAYAHDPYVHRSATGRTRIVFRLIDQPPPQTAMLPRRVHRQQTKICSLAAQLNQHASE